MKLYLLIEPFGDLYRCLIRIPIWIIYLSSLNRDSELFNYKFSILAVLLSIVYIPIKCHNLYFYCVDLKDCVKSRVIYFIVYSNYACYNFCLFIEIL